MVIVFSPICDWHIKNYHEFDACIDCLIDNICGRYVMYQKFSGKRGNQLHIFIQNNFCLIFEKNTFESHSHIPSTQIHQVCKLRITNTVCYSKSGDNFKSGEKRWVANWRKAQPYLFISRTIYQQQKIERFA